MHMIRSALAGLLALLTASSAVAQTFPTVPGQSVIGRLGVAGDTGPSQAISFARVLSGLGGARTANTVWAGPTSGAVASPTFRALVGADLPNPGASSKGGVQSITCSASNWFNTLSTGGVFGCSRPNFTDLAGSISAAQIPAGTIVDAAVSGSAAIALSKLAAQANNTAVCNVSGGSAVPVACTTTQLTSLVNVATTGLTGAAPILPNDGTKFLNGLGVYATPTSAGQMILLNTLTASASATLSDTTNITSTYSSYEIVLQNLVPATNAVTLELQVQSGGSFQATSYITATFGVSSSTTIAFVNPTTYIPLNHSNTVNNVVPGISGVIRLINPSSTTTPKNVTGTTSYATSAVTGNAIVSGYWNSNAAITGFQLLMSSGNITSGVVKIYGIQ